MLDQPTAAVRTKQWVAEVAGKAGAPYFVLEKTRYGDHDVAISLPDNFTKSDTTPVLVDDIISTGKTMIETVAKLRAAGMAPPVCIGIHAIFANTAYRDFQQIGVEKLVTTNSIRHPTNAIDLSALIAEGVERLTKS